MEKVCCEVFKSNLDKFDWFSFGESPKKTYVMPVLKGTNLRVNNCFSCGKEIRSIEIKEKEFKNYQ